MKKVKFYFLAIALIAVQSDTFVAGNVNVNIFNINTEKDPFSGMYATWDVFGADMEQVFPVAYYDINADKLTDLITVSRDRKSLVIFLAKKEPPYLRRVLNTTVVPEADEDMHIMSVRPGDFTGDGMADLMVTLAKDNYPEYGSNTTVVFCQTGYSIGIALATLHCFGSENGTVISNLVQEPTVLDLNGDMILDLLGEVWEKPMLNLNSTFDKTMVEKHRMIWISKGWKDVFGWERKPFKVVEDRFSETEMRNMTDLSSNAYADMDGDGIPELLILTTAFNATNATEHGRVLYTLETYEVVRDDRKETAFRYKIPPKHIQTDNHDQTHVLGQPIIVDFERNGKLSHLVPYCADLECKSGGIYVIEDGKAYSLPLGPMVCDNEKYDFIHPPMPSNDSIKPLTPFLMETFYTRTLVLRVGDYNLDGYPDLLGVLTNRNGAGGRKSRGFIFENVPCTPSPEHFCNYTRTFTPNCGIFNDSSNNPNAISTSFFDIGDNGVLDVILVTEQTGNPAAQDQTFGVRAFENAMNFDASFLKVMTLVGQPCVPCESGIPYGSVLPGATIKYTSINSKGQEECGVATQTFRTAHMPLDLPSEIFGIGHSPNFIEKLEVIISPNADKTFRREWLQIIPNSQVVVVPNPLEKPGGWIMKLFLTPSDIVLKTFGILVGVCAIIGTIVAALEFKERREDRLVRQSEAHRLVMY